MQSTFGGAGTFADVLTSSYGLNLPEYGDDGAPVRQPQDGAPSEAAAEAALHAAEAGGHGGGGGGGSEGGGHLITQLSAAQVMADDMTTQTTQVNV